MVINEWVIGSMVLVAAIISGALLRQRRAPAPQTPAELRWEIEDLRREVAKLREDTLKQQATIETLQSLLTDRQAEINRLTARVWQLEHSPAASAGSASTGSAGARGGASASTSSAGAGRPDDLVLVLGGDPALAVDAAALRSSDVASRFRLTVLRGPSKRRLADFLQRARTRGEPARYVHFAVHGDEAGIALADGPADGVWLSENLAGSEVVLIAGCSTSAVAHLARVAPTVVSMTDEVGMQDAMEFAAVFWGQLAAGVNPQAAFYEAARRAPAAGEMAELH